MTLGAIGKPGKQPQRDPDDDTYHVTVIAGDKLLIEMVRRDGTPSGAGQIVISEFNAWSIIGTLSLFIGLKLPKRIGERIRL